VAFGELMDMARNNAMAGGNACKPILFEPMIMSIILAQAKKLMMLEEKLNVAIAERVGLKVTKK
jgi:hypothetical protein